MFLFRHFLYIGRQYFVPVSQCCFWVVPLLNKLPVETLVGHAGSHYRGMDHCFHHQETGPEKCHAVIVAVGAYRQEVATNRLEETSRIEKQQRMKKMWKYVYLVKKKKFCFHFFDSFPRFYSIIQTFRNQISFLHQSQKCPLPWMSKCHWLLLS